MEKFLEKMQKDLDTKILSCVKGESIVKPFSQVFEEVREKPKKRKIEKPKFKSKTEESIYSEVISAFLKEHPELVAQSGE